MRVIVSGLLLLCGVLSVDALSTAEAARVNEVLVTAVAETAPVVTGEVDSEFNTGFSQNIKREQFDSRISTLSDAIAQQSGIQVRNSGGFGSFSSATLRGASSQQVLIFVDGLLLNDASGGGVDLSTISLSDVESVEVYRGATPMSLGSASIGGAINIRTLKVKDEKQGSVTLGYGDFNTQKYAAFFSTKLNDLGYVLSAERFSSDNDFEYVNYHETRLSHNDEIVKQRNNSEFLQNNLLFKLGYDIDKDQRIDTLLQWFDKQQQIPVWNNRASANTNFDVERLQSQLRLISKNVGPYAINLSNTLEYLRTVEEYDDRHSSVGLGKQYDLNTSSTIKLRSFAEVPLDFQLLSIIIELSEEKYQPIDLLGRSISLTSTRSTATIGFEDKLFLIDDKLLINPAISTTSSHDVLSDTTLVGVPPVSKVKSKHTNPRVGLKYFASDRLILKVNVGRYTRQPSFYELLGDRGFFTGNIDLISETGKNFDLGFEIALKNPFKYTHNITWQASLFYSDVEDIIVRTYNSRGVGKSENINQSQITGIENILNVRFDNKVNVSFNSTFQDMVNEQKNPALKHSQLPGRFKWSYNTRLDYYTGAWSAFVEHRYQSGMYYDSPNNWKALNKNLINMGASWKRSPMTISFEIKNMMDEDYEDFRGFPQPGRAAFTTIKIDL